MNDKETITLTSADLEILGAQGTIDPNFGAVPPSSAVSWDSMATSVYSVPAYPTISVATGPTNLGNWDFGNITFQDSMPRSGTISLRGDDADIEVNGESLMGMIRGIQDRLNILSPDPDMEQEWDQLREIRQQYEAKLAECREKSRMWKQLKDLPPPEQL